MNHWDAWRETERTYLEAVRSHLGLDPPATGGLAAPLAGRDEDVRRRMIERVALAFRVPYWLVAAYPPPRWRDRPVWRLRALYWRWR